jgi:hypothetical protein
LGQFTHPVHNDMWRIVTHTVQHISVPLMPFKYIATRFLSQNATELRSSALRIAGSRPSTFHSISHFAMYCLSCLTWYSPSCIMQYNIEHVIVRYSGSKTTTYMKDRKYR